MAIRLAMLFRRLRPTVVQSRNWPTFDSIVAARLARVPVVIHGEHGRDATDPEGRNARRRRLRRMVSPLVTTWLTVSRDLRRWLVEDVHIPARKVATIHNGVDLERFAPGHRAEARAALGLETGAPIIGTVGRLDPVKDQAGLIRAFAGLAGADPRPLLVIAGDGPCRPELEALVRDLGLGASVRLLGERHDIPRVLAALDVFVLPSIAEGISNTILEAMATGLAVIATRVGGNPELVDDGITGQLVPKQDPPALREAMAAMLADVPARLARGVAARRRVVELFSLHDMCRRHAALYDDALAARQPARA
jgi:sugar transferase (PEP-CTERM/EpsH1 system associated)